MEYRINGKNKQQSFISNKRRTIIELKFCLWKRCASSIVEQIYCVAKYTVITKRLYSYWQRTPSETFAVLEELLRVTGCRVQLGTLLGTCTFIYSWFSYEKELNRKVCRISLPYLLNFHLRRERSRNLSHRWTSFLSNHLTHFYNQGSYVLWFIVFSRYFRYCTEY